MHLHSTGNHLSQMTIDYYPVPTPHITEMYNDGGVIIPRSYAGGPKCSPSRFSILTGRFPSRGKYAIQTSEGMRETHRGTTVSVATTEFIGDDKIYNVYRTLKEDANNPYFTGMVGKWYVKSTIDTNCVVRSVIQNECK